MYTGSPLADIGFNLMLADLLHELNQLLLDSEAYHEGSIALGRELTNSSR